MLLLNSAQFFQETRRNGPVQEIEFQVSSVLNRLEAAVEKFEGNSPFSILDSKKLSSLVPRSTEDTLDLIEVTLF